MIKISKIIIKISKKLNTLWIVLIIIKIFFQTQILEIIQIRILNPKIVQLKIKFRFKIEILQEI